MSLSESLGSSLDRHQDAEIRERLASAEQFTGEYGIRGFAPYPGVGLAIGPEGSIRALRDLIHSTSSFQGASFREAVPPHMTIAEFITLERSGELLEGLGTAVISGRFECNEVVHAPPDSNFGFGVLTRYPIGSRK